MYAANFLGCIARIFTSLQEGGGYAMVRGYMLGADPAKTQVDCSWRAPGLQPRHQPRHRPDIGWLLSNRDCASQVCC